MSKKQSTRGKPKSTGKGAIRMKRNYLWMPILCVVLGLIAFIPVFKAEFVNWDDNVYVVYNQTIQSLRNFKEILTSPVQGNYHPLTMLTLAVNFALTGKDAASYHIVNLLLHMANVVLVFFFIFRLTGNRRWVAFITALLFAIHPIHVESVAWIAERKDVLYSLFFLAGLTAYLHYLEKRTMIRLLAVLALFILSLLSKPSAIIFPIVLLAIDYYYGRLGAVRSYIEKIPFLLFSVIFGLLAIHGQFMTEAVRYSSVIPVHFKFFFGFYGIMMYIVKAILPVNLCAFYPYPAVNEALPVSYYLSFLAVLLLVILILTIFRKNKLIIFAVLFYVVNLALVLQFFPVGSAILADRYSYIPMIGVFLVAGYYFQKWADSNSGNPTPMAIALLTGISFILVILTFLQSSTWKNSALLWDQAIAVAPSSKAYTNRGLIYKSANQNSNATDMFNQAIHMNEAETDAFFNRGDIFFNEKKYELAISDYNHCLAINPNLQQAIQNRGAAYMATGKYDLALTDMNLALKLNPNSVNGYANRALLEQTINHQQAAIDDFFEHMKKTPDTTGDVWNAIGVSYLRMNQNQKALECFNKAIKLTNNQVFLNNRALVLSKLRS